MRDPQRIPKVLAEIERIWIKFPDMRFHQLVDFLTHLYAKEHARSTDLFYLEDHVFLKWLEDFEFNRNGGN